MDTLSMQAIADLTHVRRPMVSIWRRRTAGSAHPFPEPVPGTDLRFDAAEIAAWLQATGLGKNPEAHLEAMLHSTRLDELATAPDAASSLLLLHHVTGEPLGELAQATAPPALPPVLPRQLLDPASVPALLANTGLVDSIDALAEAAFAAPAVLERLLQHLATGEAAWARNALTPSGTDLLLGILAVLVDGQSARIDPVGPGALLQTCAFAATRKDRRICSFGLPETEDDLAAVACRVIAAHAGPDAVDDAAFPAARRVALHVQVAETAPSEYFAQVEDLLLDLGPTDVAVVVGPAALLVDPVRDDRARAQRRDLLETPGGHIAPLRYASRLPKGLSRGGDRRRLALWVFANGTSPHAGQDWTVYGEHADADLGTASRTAIAADVAAGVSGGADLTSHAFLRSTRMVTSRFVRRTELTAAPMPSPEPSGGESLAKIWELDDGLLESELTLTAQDATLCDASESWRTITQHFAKELRGARIPAEIIGGPGAGRVSVIGTDEVRDPARLDGRAVDRLTLEASVARSTLTAPGDVVFTAEGGAAAIVDREGGRVLEAPARILRPHRAAHAGRMLHASVAAHDIASQPGRDRSTWRLRTVPVDAAEALDRASRLTDQRRRDLRRQLTVLDELDHELFGSISAGTLAARLTDTQEI